MHGRTPPRGRDEPTFSLVFPAYNPGPRLEQTWHEVLRFQREAPQRWEVLFVCDGSTDGTPERLRQLVRTTSADVQVLSYQPNRGKGYAVRLGLRAARGAWRLFTDIDLAYGFEDIQRLAQALQAGADVVIASRTHPGSRVLLPTALQGYVYRRHLQSLLFAALARCLLPLTQRDLQAGLKGISAHVAQTVLPQLNCNGFGFDCELLTACVRYGFSIVELPVQVRYEDRASTTGLRSMGRMIGDLLRIRRTWRRLAPVAAVPVLPSQREVA